MTGSQAVELIHSVAWQGSKPGLERTLTLLEALGRPDRKLKYIHIAGTNGKGSTAAMLASVLHQAGYRVGLYTSPYLQKFNERMQVDGRPISDEALGLVTAHVAPFAHAMADRPTEFELMTCIALQWFADHGCDIVVLETGLGGRLDSTNVIEKPEVCVLTAIGLDHTEILGSTLSAIAREKAGILKPHVPVVLYDTCEEVTRTVRSACQTLDCPLTIPDFNELQVVSDGIHGQCFDYRPLLGLRLNLLGAHQRKNAAVVIETLRLLRHAGWHIPDRATYAGLAEARWPGRFEILRSAPFFLADGGHNPQCAQALAVNLTHYFPGRKFHFLLGMMADKDWHTVMEIIAPLAASFTTVTPENPRSLPAAVLGDYLERYGRPVTVCPSVRSGVQSLLARTGEEEVICSFGSLYLTGEVRPLLLGPLL